MGLKIKRFSSTSSLITLLEEYSKDPCPSVWDEDKVPPEDWIFEALETDLPQLFSLKKKGSTIEINFWRDPKPSRYSEKDDLKSIILSRLGEIKKTLKKEKPEIDRRMECPYADLLIRYATDIEELCTYGKLKNPKKKQQQIVIRKSPIHQKLQGLKQEKGIFEVCNDGKVEFLGDHYYWDGRSWWRGFINPEKIRDIKNEWLTRIDKALASNFSLGDKALLWIIDTKGSWKDRKRSTWIKNVLKPQIESL